MEAIMGGLGIAGGLMNMFGSSPANNAMNVQAPPMYTQDPSAGFAGQQSMIPGLGQYNLGGQNLGAYQSYLSSALSNPYGFGGQSAANAFSGAGMGTSLGALGNAGALGGQVPGMIGASNAVLGSAFDPQGALYGRTLGQLTDQEGAYLANAGVGTSPYGAGLMGQTLGNFNIDWQNQQLGREVQGLGAYTGGIGAAGQTASGAYGLGSQAAGGGAQFGMLPWNTFNTLGGMPLNLLSGASQYGVGAANIPQQQIGDWQQYVSGAGGINQGATGLFGQELNQARLASQQQAMAGAQLGQGFGMLGQGLGLPQTYNMFGGGGGGGGNYNTSSGLFNWMSH